MRLFVSRNGDYAALASGQLEHDERAVTQMEW